MLAIPREPRMPVPSTSSAVEKVHGCRSGCPPLVVTVAVNVTEWPNVDGFADEVIAVVVAARGAEALFSTGPMSPAVPTFLDRPRWSTVSRLPFGSVLPLDWLRRLPGYPRVEDEFWLDRRCRPSWPSFASWPRILPVVTPLMRGE